MRAVVLIFSFIVFNASAHIPNASEVEKAKAKFDYIKSEFFDCLKKDKTFSGAYCSKVKKRYKELLKRKAGDPFKD